MASTIPQTSFRDWVQQRGPRKRGYERVLEFGLFLCGLFSIAVTLAIAGVILVNSYHFFTYHDGVPLSGQQVWNRVLDFFTNKNWTESTQEYGILPLLSASFMVTIIAALLAIPVGLLTAIYLSEYASPRIRGIAKPILELLAGIPTVVYGFFAIEVVSPMLGQIVPGLNQPHNLLSGGVVVGIMIIPMVASLSEDSLRAVPRSLRDGAIALGANKFETSVKVVLPAALSGVVASFILAISRAVGETMAVTLACGETPRLTFDPREGAATMTSFIVHRALGDTSNFSTDFDSLFAVAGVLFLITLGMNVIAQKVLRRYRQVYQ